MTSTPPTDQQLDEYEAIASRAVADPFYVSDCEGSLQVWREKALTHVRRDADGEIDMYSFPSTYKVTDQIIELDLSTWDPGEDATDDRQRQDIRELVEARAALPVLLDTIRRQRARVAELEVGLNDLAALVSQWYDRATKAEARVAELAAVPDRLEVVLTERYTALGNPFSRMDVHEQGPDGWPMSTPVSPNDVAGVVRELVTAPAPPAAPLSASPASSASESTPSPTGAPTGRLEDLPTTEDLASADNPIQLRWGLNDVLWSDDDSVIVMLSGPDREAYWLELDPERAAVLREDLAGPDGEQQSSHIALTRSDLAVLLAHHADVLAAQLRADPARDAWIAAERLTEHANELTSEKEPPAVAELLDNIWTFDPEQQLGVDEPA